VKILFIWLYVYIYNDGNSFSLVFELCGNMNFLEINARLRRKLESFSNLVILDYICE